jgi:flagellar basal-body rod protein FlgC
MTLSDSLNISANSLMVQSARMKVHAANIANVATPYYQRQIPVLAEDTSTTFQDVIKGMRTGVIQAGMSFGPGGVTMPDIVSDTKAGQRLYEPGHPLADKDGFITQSNVDPMVDMADAMSTSRLYEASISDLGIVKSMANRALEIGRGQ